MEDFFPGGLKDPRHLRPGKASRPHSQELHVGDCQGVRACRPGHRFHFHPTPLAVHAPQGVDKKHRDPPQGHKLKFPNRQGVIARTGSLTSRTDRTGVGARPQRHAQTQRLTRISPFHAFIDKRLVFLNPIQNTLQLHPVLFLCRVSRSNYPYRNWDGMRYLFLREGSKTIPAPPTNSAEEPRIQRSAQFRTPGMARADSRLQRRWVWGWGSLALGAARLPRQLAA